MRVESQRETRHQVTILKEHEILRLSKTGNCRKFEILSKSSFLPAWKNRCGAEIRKLLKFQWTENLDGTESPEDQFIRFQGIHMVEIGKAIRSP